MRSRKLGQSGAPLARLSRVTEPLSHQDTLTVDRFNFKRPAPAAGPPNFTAGLKIHDDGSVQPVATLLNMSVVGGRDVESESLTTFDQLSQDHHHPDSRHLYPLLHFP